MWWMDRRMAEWRCSNINITKRTASVVCKWVLTEQFCVCLKFSVTKYCKGEGAGGVIDKYKAIKMDGLQPSVSAPAPTSKNYKPVRRETLRAPPQA